MPDVQKTFSLVDGEGKRHEYIIHAHTPMESQEIMLRVANGLARPVARILQSNALKLFKTFMGSNKKVKVDVDEEDEDEGWKNIDVEEFLEGSDLNLVGALDDLTAALLEIHRAGLMPKLFSHVSRDGLKLSDTDKFDAAYIRNYGEQAAAAIEIIRFNGWIDFLFGALPDQARAVAQKTLAATNG